MEKSVAAACDGDEEEEGAAKEGKRKGVTAMFDAMMPLAKSKDDDSDGEGQRKGRRRATPKAKAAPEDPKADFLCNDFYGIQIKQHVFTSQSVVRLHRQQLKRKRNKNWTKPFGGVNLSSYTLSSFFSSEHAPCSQGPRRWPRKPGIHPMLFMASRGMMP